MKRIGIVGCGAIAKSHALGVQDLGFECVAVTDLRSESAAAFAQGYRELRADWLGASEWKTDEGRKKLRGLFAIPAVTKDLAEMVKNHALDAVIIATWPGSHAELVIQAAILGVPAIFCEKPMAMSPTECEAMVEACEKVGARLVLYHEGVTLLPQVRKAREVLESGEIGEAKFIRAYITHSLMDWSPYAWAAIQYLFPEMEMTRVQAALDFTREVQAFGHAHETSGIVHFELGEAIHGVLYPGRSGLTKYGLRVDGSEGAFELSFIFEPTLLVQKKYQTNWAVAAPPRTITYDDRRDLLGGVLRGDSNFDRFNGRSALKSMLPVYAAWQSHFERRPVALDEAVSFEIPVQPPVTM